MKQSVNHYWHYFVLGSVFLLMAMGCEQEQPNSVPSTAPSTITPSTTPSTAPSVTTGRGGLRGMLVALPFKPKEFEQIVADHASGQLTAQNDEIVLPNDKAGLTVDGSVYITQDPSGDGYLFRTWRGKGRNFRGYLYWPTNQAISQGATSVIINGPNAGSLDSFEAQIKPTSRADWYEAWFDLD